MCDKLLLSTIFWLEQRVDFLKKWKEMHHMIPKTDICLDGKKLSRIALGTHCFNIRTEKASGEILDRYVENGGNIIDTARCYGEDVTNPNDPQSERCIGSWLKASGMRKQMVLITKGGNPEYVKGKHVRNRITAADVEQDLTKSLSELKTDYIDIYFFHKDDPLVDAGEAIEILNKYVKAGVVKHIGASNWSFERIKEANEYAQKNSLAKFEYSEVAFSLKDRVTKGWGEKELTHEMSLADYNYYRESQMPVIGYGAQAYGFFYGDQFPEDDSEKNQELFQRLKKICDRKQINAHQALYGFYFGCDVKTIPLISAKNTARLQEAMENCDTILDKAEIRYLLERRFDDQ